MVDITLLELDMEGAEFNAPFSGKEGKMPSGSKVSKMLKRSRKSSSSSKSSSKSPGSLLSGSDDSGSSIDVDVTEGEESPTSAAPFLLLVGLVVMFAVLRRLRSRQSGREQHELVEYEA